jgi:hypothetical protein
MISTEIQSEVLGTYREKKINRTRNNFKDCHNKGEIILEVDGEVKQIRRYGSKKQRTEWLATYSRQIKRNYVIILIPDLKNWNGVY